MNLGNPVASYPLLVGTNLIPGLSVSLPLTLARNAHNYLTIGVSTSIFDQPTLSVTTLTASGDIQLGGTLKTNRTDETLLFKATKYSIYDKFFTEIFGHGGITNYMNQNLDMKGKSISLASQLSALTYVYTPTIRAANIEFWDVSNTGATDLIIKSGFTNFIDLNTVNGFNVYKPLFNE